jgi:hypothetical protein
VSQAKPGRNRPGQAGPEWRLRGLWPGLGPGKPEPGRGDETIKTHNTEMLGERTFSVNPQERTSRFADMTQGVDHRLMFVASEQTRDSRPCSRRPCIAATCGPGHRISPSLHRTEGEQPSSDFDVSAPRPSLVQRSPTPQGADIHVGECPIGNEKKC